jgi:acetylornithine deacetylase/succinyl-diaminopimelate desuccinylase-like protein
VAEPLVDDLFELLRIPSISTGGGDSAALQRAAEWLAERITRAGGKAELVSRLGGNPVVVGELKASREGAPTVLVYGHYDVQGVDPIVEWDSDPFEPEIRQGRIYARGASDDKGNFWPMLYVACELANKGQLPVNVRAVIEGEEEAGGAEVAQWFAEDERGADCAIVFDSGMVDEGTPAVTLSVRGIVAAAVDVVTGRRNLHSGIYGGSVLNAIHVLQAMLDEVLPGPDGVLRDELREGIIPPSDTEVATWSRLPPGDRVLAQVGGRPIDRRSGTDYYMRNGADASLDVNGIAGGDAVNSRTIVPARANAKLSMRLAPGQDTEAMRAVLESLMMSAIPQGAEVKLEWHMGSSALFDAESPPLQAGVEALERATGMPVALVRSGGSIPILAEFARRGIQTIVSGFALPEDAIHAPNESYRVESLRLGERAAHELYGGLAKLGSE